ncbi:hypothetical protein EPUS_06029 [Endocarpon pusillum Z07020]|uniref:Uncharacterized protein n=1 Tax=Endocarpon pusillum (strain Z07020 / HMAS-L-300199) TaxID=1263415 RepID=U1HPR9_ENDPU|nr:uncharacterized protein EPUS_06029 [Endocarpon pusillum Z07020]ERF72400.1 hypothetical protein EPUS_06029 [Endocarpon pusillum Z07020]
MARQLQANGTTKEQNDNVRLSPGPKRRRSSKIISPSKISVARSQQASETTKRQNDETTKKHSNGVRMSPGPKHRRSSMVIYQTNIARMAPPEGPNADPANSETSATRDSDRQTMLSGFEPRDAGTPRHAPEADPDALPVDSMDPSPVSNASQAEPDFPEGEPDSPQSQSDARASQIISIEDITPYETKSRPSISRDTTLGLTSSYDTPKRERPRLGRQTRSKFAKEKMSQSASAQSSLLSAICSDTLKLPRATYHYWKWPVLLYILWLLFSHLSAAVYMTITEKFEPICSLPLVGQKLPMCHHQFEAPIKATSPTRISTTEQQMENVVNLAQESYGVGKIILSKEFALRDLRIRVRYSKLRFKNEFLEKMDVLIPLSRNSSDGLTKFAVRVSGLSSSAISANRFAVNTLQDIIVQQNSPPSLAQILASSLLPFSAFNPIYKNELEIRDVLMHSIIQVNARLVSLIDLASSNLDNLERILDNLAEIRGFAEQEHQHSPEKAVLAELWLWLARHDDFETYKSHHILLTDITVFYKTALDVMRVTVQALLKMRSDLDEFEDLHTSPAIAWRDVPLQVTIDTMNDAVRRLESERKQLEGMWPF